MNIQKNKHFNIMITGGNFIGKGAEAMMRVVIEQVKHRLPNVQFWSIPAEGEEDKMETVGVNIVYPHSRGKTNLNKRLLLILDLLGIGNLRRKKAIAPGDTSSNPFQATDYVIDISGFGFSDQRGTKVARRRWIFFRKARHAQNKLFFLPQSWGPFEKFWVRKHTQWTLKHASLIYAREEKSYEYLKHSRCASLSKIRRSVDIAFLFNSSHSNANTLEVLSQTSLKNSTLPFIAITPNMRIYEKIAQTNVSNKYEDLLVKLTDKLIKSTDYNVLLIPHESTTWEEYNDAYLCSSIASKVGCYDRVATLPDSLSAAEVKEVIGMATFIIASRYHSLVAGLSKRIPVAAIGWSHKYDELMEMVGLSDFVVDVLQDDLERAYDVAMNALEQRSLIYDRINKHMPKLEKDIANVFDDIVAAINGDYGNLRTDALGE